MRIDRLAAAALAVTVAALIGGAQRAEAHGSPTTPISRTSACADGGTDTGTAACKAARKANGGGFGKFDNLRIAGVNGKDRQVVPDGKLCSGGLDAFAGLDLPRDDFPATKVNPGKTLTIRYRATIPHAGEFRVFLTGSSYDPSKRLTWDDLGSKPIAAVTDPDLNDGAYQLKAKLPERTGRQILYIVWETSSTPDTYYSCSDLVFPAVAAVAPATTKPKPTATKTTEAPQAKATSAQPATPRKVTSEAPPAPELNPVAAEKAAAKPTDKVTLGHWIVAGALAFGFAAIAWAGVGTFLRRRRENR